MVYSVYTPEGGSGDFGYSASIVRKETNYCGSRGGQLGVFRCTPENMSRSMEIRIRVCIVLLETTSWKSDHGQSWKETEKKGKRMTV